MHCFIMWSSRHQLFAVQKHYVLYITSKIYSRGSCCYWFSVQIFCFQVFAKILSSLWLLTIITERCHVTAILMGRLALSVKNMVVNVRANQTLLGDVVKLVALGFMVSLTADRVIVLQLRFVRLTQVRWRFMAVTTIMLKISVWWGITSCWLINRCQHFKDCSTFFFRFRQSEKNVLFISYLWLFLNCLALKMKLV